MSFGQRLRGLRRDYDLSQAELGTQAGCSVNTVRKLEADERRPSRELARRLSEVFDISARERADFVRMARGGIAGRPSLPTPMTRLIGREQDVANVRGRLLAPDVRLLTLLGPPGVGKTRLALQLATDLQDEFTNGAVFVALAALRDPALVSESIAQTLGVRSSGSRALEPALIQHIGSRHLLLVLDNFEQVLAAREQVARLLAGAPRLKVLVTSRAALDLYGEHVFGVPPLGRSPAEKLFLERARSARANFAAAGPDRPIVTEICLRLEGLPLALELAASRARSMSPAALLEQLGHRLDVLSTGPTDFAPRQRSMRGALDWSYELLGEPERVVFALLAVFSGGATMEAIEAVCAGSFCATTNVKHAVEGLADKSLVHVCEVANTTRFEMLETIQEYAYERMVDLDCADVECGLRRHHAEYFTTLAEQAAIGLRGAEQIAWLERLTADQSNLRSALGWAFAEGAGELAGRLCAALWPFWRARGLVHEGRRWLSQALAFDTGVTTVSRASVLNGAGVLALIQNDYALAGELLAESRELYTALGDAGGVAFAVSNLGWLAHDCSETSRARALFEESLRTRRLIGDVVGEASSLNNLGMMALERPDVQEARALFGRSAELYRRSGNPIGLAQALSNLGWAEQELGDYARATALFSESLALAQRLEDARAAAHNLSNLGLMALYGGHYVRANDYFIDAISAFNDLGDRRGVAEGLEGAAGVDGVQGRPEHAAQLFGVAEALRETIGAPLLPADRSRYESVLAAAREQLDDQTWQRAWAAGRAATVEEIVRELLGVGSVAARAEEPGGAGRVGRHVSPRT
ncbi:MAG TPA: tetratricopeptide repeat protein [Chloroflexota bacterium]|nr:tetratricopeptide repeat protein [Chloroflexota bacterium]